MMDTHEGIEFLDVCLNSTTSVDCQRKGSSSHPVVKIR